MSESHQKNTVTYYVSWLIFLFLLGSITAQYLGQILISLSYPEFKGKTLIELTDVNPSAWNLVRCIQLFHSVLGFALPAYWVWRKYTGTFKIDFYTKGYKLTQGSFFVILLIVSILPIVQYIYDLNQSFHFFEPLQTILTNMENQAEKISQGMLSDKSTMAIIFNFFIIAVLASLCEEIFFRGVLQKILSDYLQPYIAIFIAAFIFSFIHFQFFGFLPRLALGILLGLIYYHTRQLIFPIIGHFFFNGLQLFLYYQIDESTLKNLSDKNQSIVILSLLSLVLFTTLYIYFKNFYLKINIKNGNRIK